MNGSGIPADAHETLAAEDRDTVRNLLPPSISKTGAAIAKRIPMQLSSNDFMLRTDGHGTSKVA